MDKLTLDFTENTISQIPAVQLLINLGYQYLTADEVLQFRGRKTRKVLLENILIPWLRENNRIESKGQSIPFTESNIINAVQELKDVPFDGLIRTNEKIYDLLCLGKSLQQSIDGDLKSFTLNYIDWKHPGKNIYHITEEYEVEKKGSYELRKPDIVLFVNGIPLVVIECKSPAIKDPLKQAISQQIRNQKEDEIPLLFIYSQLLFAICKDDAKYATTGTPAKFWALWREEYKSQDEEELKLLCNKVLPLTERVKILSWRKNHQKYEYLLEGKDRIVTPQDEILYSLCRPERLLELTYQFILYDAGEKKVARYQQYFCVHRLIDRILTIENNHHKGGVVWHTQGSGKSLTMVMLAKAIALSKDIPDYKIVLVTDRIDLDEQIRDTFKHCGKDVEQSKTGMHLSRMLMGTKERIITTVIDKFESALGRHTARNEDSNIFVLVDEGHRGQFGARHAKMRLVLPNACYIGFTGTPIMKKDRDTLVKFGGLIDKYTIDQAVKDKAVVPLLYEGRHVQQKVDSDSIDDWFERITENLSPEQTKDLKKKFSTTEQLNKTEQKIMRVAWDISIHFRDNWQNTGYKGQLVTQSKVVALLYKKHLDECGMITSEVLISGPDEREGEEDIYTENTDPVIRFWKSMMQKYGNEKTYNRQIIQSFKFGDTPEIIIVVDKLLTGFDAPRNTVLYLTRNLKDYLLLQAIARVNRLYEDKDYGYIIDYRGVLQNLSKAMDLYTEFDAFDEKDIENTWTDVSEQIRKVSERYSLLWDLFKEIRNKQDEEEFERFLEPEDIRVKFYDRLSGYARSLSIAISTEQFWAETPSERINQYKKDLDYFSKLRSSIRRRYSDTVDFSFYEPKIQKLLDTYVSTGEIEPITSLVDIFDKDAFKKEVENIESDSAKADTIAYRTKRTINDHMQEDPAFYRKFSQMLEDAINAFREERLRAREYLNKVAEIMNSVLNRTGDRIPDKLLNHDVAKAYFGVLRETLSGLVDKNPDLEDAFADIALKIETIINSSRIVNWVNDMDIQNKMKNMIDDLLFEFKSKHNLNINLNDMDNIIDQTIDIAKVRLP